MQSPIVPHGRRTTKLVDVSPVHFWNILAVAARDKIVAHPRRQGKDVGPLG